MTECQNEDEQPPPIPSSSFYRYVVFGGGCCQLFLASALCNGWPSLRDTLRKEGIYRELCPDYEGMMNHTDDLGKLCPERSQHFVQIFASSFNATRWGLFFAGLFLKSWSPKKVNTTALFVNGVAFLLLSAVLNQNPFGSFTDTTTLFLPPQISEPFRIISSSFLLYLEYLRRSLPWIFASVDPIEVSILLLAFSGTILYSTTLHLASLFPHRRKFALSLLAGSMGFCPLVFYLVNASHEAKILSLEDLFIVGAILQFFLAVSAFFLQPSVSLNPPSVSSQSEERNTFKSLVPKFISAPFLCSVLHICVSFLILNFYLAVFQERMEELGDTQNVVAKRCTSLILLGPFAVPLFGILLEVFDIPLCTLFVNVLLGVLCLTAAIAPLDFQFLAMLAYAVGRPIVSSLQLTFFTILVGPSQMTLAYGVASPVTGKFTSFLAPMLRQLSNSTSLSYAFKLLACSTSLLYFPIALLGKSATKSKSD